MALVPQGGALVPQGGDWIEALADVASRVILNQVIGGVSGGFKYATERVPKWWNRRKFSRKMRNVRDRVYYRGKRGGNIPNWKKNLVLLPIPPKRSFRKSVSKGKMAGNRGGAVYSGRKRKGSKRSVSMRKRRGKVSPAVKAFVRRSAKALINQRKRLGSTVIERRMNTGIIQETTFNTAKYTIIPHNAGSTLEAYLAAGVKQLGDDNRMNDIEVNFDATDRKHGEFGMKMMGGYESYIFRNNDAIDVYVELTVYRCIETNGHDFDGLFDEAVQQKHLTDSVNRFSPLLNIRQYESYFRSQFKRMKASPRICLRPGDEYKFSFPLLKGTFDSTYYNLHETETYVKNCSQVLCIRTQGSIVNDSSDHTKVGTSKHELQWINNKVFRWKPMHSKEMPHDNITEVLDTITTGEQTNTGTVGTNNPN